jgi:hypothetical protein
LIAGLPGEDLESFADGFDRLVALGPQEIQVGILKRLRGTPIVRHDHACEMVYSAHPPYEILRNGLLDFETMQRLRRFARYWDLTANSGNFIESAPLIWKASKSPFRSWLYGQVGRRHAIALERLAESLFVYLTGRGHNPRTVAESLWRDWQRGGRPNVPPFLQPYIGETPKPRAKDRLEPRRQARHLAQK